MTRDAKRRLLLSTNLYLFSGIQPRPDFDPTIPDAAEWQKAHDEAVRRGLLEPIGVNCDGKTVYRRTSKKNDTRLH
jgi:hypothetical protein